MASAVISFPRSPREFARGHKFTCETERVFDRWQGIICRDGKPIATTGKTYRTEREALQGAHAFCTWQNWNTKGVARGQA